jgi:hypothetical protein
MPKFLKYGLFTFFYVYHQHGQDKITSTKHVLAGQLDNRDNGHQGIERTFNLIE